MFKYTITFLQVLLCSVLFSQNKTKIYFDKSGKVSPEVGAYYYRVESDTVGYFHSYFLSNSKIAFKGKITNPSLTDESQNLYEGVCYWYFKNGNPKYIKNYNKQNIEIGTSKYYYESGKISKEIEYENGRVKDNTYTEYDENGTRNRIFEEEFNNTFNEWDLYMSDKSSSAIINGEFELESISKEGTSRYINIPITSGSYAVESSINIGYLKDNDKVGLIYGFKNWDNYHYFSISKKSVYIGSVYEGINSVDVDAMFCNNIKLLENNHLKIICNGENIYYSVNGEVQYSDNANLLYGNNFGFVVSGNSRLRAQNLIVKEMAVTSGHSKQSPADENVKATGSGIIFSSSGLFITNHHVIENSEKFVIEVNENNVKKNYNAELVTKDKENDLAILKIKDESFKNFPSINYAFKQSGQVEVGSMAFTIGYPLALNGMGKDAKFTDGKISSKTGYDGAINTFQSTIPVQPGNSGGPVFNEQGQLIGLINASIRNADNVSYAVKLNYVKNLIEVLTEQVEIPSNTSISSLSLEEKIKVLTNYVVLIKVK